VSTTDDGCTKTYRHAFEIYQILLHYASVRGDTPKAFANSSPGLLQPWDDALYSEHNAESVG